MDSEETLNDCSICLESLNTNKHEITTLHCGHMFHERCIVQWGSLNQNVMECPLCRAKYNIQPNAIMYIHNEQENNNNVTSTDNIGYIINRLTLIKFTKRRIIIMSFTLMDILFGLIHLVISGHISNIFGMCISVWGYIGAKWLRVDYLIGYLSICIFKSFILTLTAGEYIYNIIVHNKQELFYDIHNQNVYILYIIILFINVYLSYITFYLIQHIKTYKEAVLQLINISVHVP